MFKLNFQLLLPVSQLVAGLAGLVSRAGAGHRNALAGKTGLEDEKLPVTITEKRDWRFGMILGDRVVLEFNPADFATLQTDLRLDDIGLYRDKLTVRCCNGLVFLQRTSTDGGWRIALVGWQGGGWCIVWHISNRTGLRLVRNIKLRRRVAGDNIVVAVVVLPCLVEKEQHDHKQGDQDESAIFHFDLFRFAMRNRIFATRIQRMAARQSTQCEPTATQAAVLFNSLRRITRAAGIETALIADERTEYALIAADQEDQETGHRFRSCIQY